MKANEDIRRALGANGLKQWEVAERLEILECNFSRKLRHELPEAEKTKIFAVINQIAAEREVE